LHLIAPNGSVGPLDRRLPPTRFYAELSPARKEIRSAARGELKGAVSMTGIAIGKGVDGASTAAQDHPPKSQCGWQENSAKIITSPLAVGGTGRARQFHHI
jgi:hypothetical protein